MEIYLSYYDKENNPMGSIGEEVIKKLLSEFKEGKEPQIHVQMKTSNLPHDEIEKLPDFSRWPPKH